MKNKRAAKSRGSTDGAIAPSFAGLNPASDAASRAKRANRRKDTAHEILLRRTLWRLGLRYRKNVCTLPGTPDLVFAMARVVVFCDGDFWHGRYWIRLQRDLARRHNAAYWQAKISGNRERDVRNTALLSKQGWLVLRLWETDIKRDPGAASKRVQEVLQARTAESR